MRERNDYDKGSGTMNCNRENVPIITSVRVSKVRQQMALLLLGGVNKARKGPGVRERGEPK